MEKIDLPNATWGYLNFISEEERLELLDWANKNFNRLNSNGFNRFYSPIKLLRTAPECLRLIKQRIIDTDSLKYEQTAEIFGDFLSFNLQGAAIHFHTDRSIKGCTHTRYNLLINTPAYGGNPVYNDNLIEIEPRFIWRCEASNFMHGSTQVVDDSPRINISFEFLTYN